jgi:hypothetical protein
MGLDRFTTGKILAGCISNIFLQCRKGNMHGIFNFYATAANILTSFYTS